ncbi:GMC family oxidoreductase N-terminal domain-containing protein [Methanobacterium oryzae]|uniref:GMC family oxidoreductase N-terminal domain-containing protein n=1 Tax=Methanobacterium oryzae TaxID=69540 RepID=UPI003D192318
MKTIVVGSGVGGGTVAKELAKSGVQVTLIEKGPLTEIKRAHKHYEILNVGTEISQTVCVGGTSLVTAGNAVRTCESMLKKLGIDLSREFNETDNELSVNTLPDSHFGEGTKRIMKAAGKLGFEVQKMPKFIDPDLCKPCGKCVFGCPENAKWTSVDFIEESKKYGANLIQNTPVTDIIVSNGIVKGVKSYDKIFEADNVILSTGAIETPRLLQKLGIDAGNNLFVDTFVTVGGMLKNIKYNKELSMNALIKLDGIVLAPHFSGILVEKLKQYNARKKDILGMMVKIKDEPSGKVTPDEVIKFNTANDVGLLSRGSSIAGSILTETGVDPKTLVSTYARGAHPGGTAAIGDIVDKNLKTSIEGLYVADASVFPEAPGAPPVLTIIALAKRLAKHIIDNNI